MSLKAGFFTKKQKKPCFFKKIFKKVWKFKKSAYLCNPKRKEWVKCGNSSVGRAQPCQGWGREFESRFPLQKKVSRDADLNFAKPDVVQSYAGRPLLRSAFFFIVPSPSR